jgi:hypothetical protein
MFLSSHASDAISAKIDVTPVWHFCKELFEWSNETEQYKCQSYCDDDGMVMDCTCGKCK